MFSERKWEIVVASYCILCSFVGGTIIEERYHKGTIDGIGKRTITVEAVAGNDINILQLKTSYTHPMSVNLLFSIALDDLGFEGSMKPGHGVNVLRDGEIMRYGLIVEFDPFFSGNMDITCCTNYPKV
jgi:hypothetical protein